VTDRTHAADSPKSGENTDVEEVEAGEKAPGSMQEEVDRAQEREEDAAEG
jgi:hypothetical protein